MSQEDVHVKLMHHLSLLGMSFPPKDDLLTILRKHLTSEEARVLLALPSKQVPFKGISLEEISKTTEFSLKRLKTLVKNLSKRGFMFSSKDKDTGIYKYALQQPGFGFPQIFFWKNEDTPEKRDLARQIISYYDLDVTKKTFCTKPLPYRFVPVKKAIDVPTQGVLPFHVMENIIKSVEIIAVAHCMCRVEMKLLNRGCNHPTEVCMKFNDLARYMIENGFAREISTAEALEINKKASEAGLVHFTDNAMGNIQQACNCCGCSCWNLGRIRRRHVPRDEIIATYFIRETSVEKCTGCGNCSEICPTNAIIVKDNKADWCIGCGLCFFKCSNDAIKIVPRKDLKYLRPEKDFFSLHEKILKYRESGSK